MESLKLVALAIAVLVSFPLFKMLRTEKPTDTPMFRNNKEMPQPVSLPVIGQLPAWLNGTLFRIGQSTSRGCMILLIMSTQ